MTRKRLGAPTSLRRKDAVATGSRSRFFAIGIEVAVLLPAHGIRDLLLGVRRVAGKERFPPCAVKCLDDPPASHRGSLAGDDLPGPLWSRTEQRAEDVPNSGRISPAHDASF